MNLANPLTTPVHLLICEVFNMFTFLQNVKLHILFYQSKARQKASKMKKRMDFETTISQAVEVVTRIGRDPGCLLNNPGSGNIKGIFK